ncbi:MAG: hypothetical protein ACRYG2_03780 [Janthinobacterium lividum]
MRQTVSRLNRTWLTILGVLLLLVGAAGLLLSIGQAASLTRQTGLGWTPPPPDRQVVGSATSGAFGLTWVVLVTVAVAVVIALLALAWLIAQIPRANAAKPFRLHDDARTGLTRVESDVLTDAVEAQVKSLPGVNGASAVLRGTAERPDLTLRVTADDRTDVSALLGRLHDQVAADLGDALDTRLGRLGVQVEVAAGKSGSDHITL